MQPDIVLLSLPNKNIDYPGLALPALTGALREQGFAVVQTDWNIIIRDAILTDAGLQALVCDTIPRLAWHVKESGEELRRLLATANYLAALRQDPGFCLLEETKRHAQNRDYRWIFANEGRFQAYLALFKVNRALHHILDLESVVPGDPDSEHLAGLHVSLQRSLGEMLSRERPEAVGLTILENQRTSSLRLVRWLRDTYDGKIIVGGADPTRFPMEYVQMVPGIDAVFVREAEVSLPAYLRALRDGTAPNDVPGVVSRGRGGRIVSVDPRAVDLSTLPSPDFGGLPLDLYLTPALPVQSSRGCYWHRCRFCIHWNTYHDFRERDTSRVIEDIGRATTLYGTRYFHFTDDCIPVPQARRLAEMIVTGGLDIRWLAYFRFEDKLDRDLLRSIYAAGGRVLEMGLESASPRMLELMNKNISVETANRIAVEAAEEGLLVKLFMFHGFPGETIQDAHASVRFAEDHIERRNIRPFMPLRNRFELVRGAQVYESSQLGQEPDIAKAWWPSGAFGVRAEYERACDEEPARELVAGFVGRIRRYMAANRIYSTNDDNIMLDLVVLDHMPLPCGWRCI